MGLQIYCFQLNESNKYKKCLYLVTCILLNNFRQKYYLMKVFRIILSITLLFFADTVEAQQITLLQQGKPTNIRGISVVNDKIAWVSGSNGYVAVTTNSGKTWAWQQIKGFEQADFRDVEAFSDKEAIIMSSGTPALLLKTTDAGQTWKINYRNIDTAYFLDAMDFSDNKHGFVLGDPIKDKFLLLETKDGGNTWNNYPNAPTASKGEASFAASGTCLRVTSDNTVFIVTGGNAANVNKLQTNTASWIQYSIPILKGQAAQGAFSIAINNKQMVIVGGDYQHDHRTDSTACYSANNGKTWQSAHVFPAGYQSCVEFINDNKYLSTGTPGTNITIDGGNTWAQIDTNIFNICRKAKHGNLVLLGGSNGKIAIFKL